MKKLIIAAFAIALAAVSQAATVKWTAGKVYEMGTDTKASSSYIAYFVSSADFSYADAVASIAKEKIDFLSTYGQASKTFASGVATQTITTTAGNSESWTGYLVILDNTSISDASHAYITTEQSKSTGSTGQAAAFAWADLSATKSASNWSAVNVPEPTSGLLLLLGMAGMALRRKQA